MSRTKPTPTEALSDAVFGDVPPAAAPAAPVKADKAPATDEPAATPTVAGPTAEDYVREIANLNAENASLRSMLSVDADDRPSRTKLVRLDGTHAVIRIGDRSVSFQPYLHDTKDARPHRIVDNDEAVMIQAREPGKFLAERVVTVDAEPAA